MSSIRKLASQTAIYGISSILGRFVNWALTPLYTSVLPEEEYGIITYLYAYLTYFLVILTFGMETAYFRFSMDSDHHVRKSPYDQSFLLVNGLGFLFFIGVSLNFRTFAGLIQLEEHPFLVLYSAIILFLDVGVALPMSKLRYKEMAMKYAIITVISIFVNVGLNLIFILVMKLDFEYILIANIFSSLVKLALALPGSLPESWKPDWQSMKPMAGFGFFIMAAGLLGMINQNIDKNLIPYLWEKQYYAGEMRNGQNLLGLYSAGYKLAMFILLFTQAFRYAAEPFFFKHAAAKKSRTMFAKVFHYYMILCMAGFLMVSCFSLQIASFDAFGLLGFTLIGKAYWPGLNVVPVLLISYSLLGAYTNLSIWFKMTKQTRFGILFSGAGASVIVVLNIILIPITGYMGAAWASVAGFLLMCLLVYYFGQKYYAIPYRLDRLSLYLIITGLAYWIARSAAEDAPWTRFFIVICAIGLIVGLERARPTFTVLTGNVQKDESQD